MDNHYNISIEHTADGSSTLYIRELDEHYHSIKGAITEAHHIYRNCAFMHRSDGNTLRLLEIGFGTGLNATVTAMAADALHPVHYISLEKHPIPPTILDELHYERLLDKNIFDSIHRVQWNKPFAITPHFSIEKRECDYLNDPLPHNIDIVYFDAFAPEKQPEMWSKEAFERLYECLNPHAVLTTYCSKGEIRRLFTRLGFSVERLPGPPGGKREILRATKIL